MLTPHTTLESHLMLMGAGPSSGGASGPGVDVWEWEGGTAMQWEANIYIQTD